MTTVAGREVISAVQVVVGVDSHRDEHMAVAIDQQGVRLAGRCTPATGYGYGETARWFRKMGEVRALGIERTAFLAACLPGSWPVGASPSSRSTGLTSQLDTGMVRATPPTRKR